MERLLFEFALRSALIFLAAAMALRALRIRSAAAQHAVWVGVLLVMLALPVWISWGPKAVLPVLPSRAAPAVLPTLSPANFDPPELSIPAAEASDASSHPASIGRAFSNWRAIWSWSFAWIAAYLLGAGALLLRLAIGTIRATRLTSASCAAPVTVGLFRPKIILPECASDWPQSQLDAVMTHERAHVRRRDPLVLWLALFNRALFWFHPLAWWLERRLSGLAEEACDAAVLERGHDPRDYSEYLLDIARAVERAGLRVNVTAMAMPGSQLPRRIRKIIVGARMPRVSRLRMVAAAIACAICSAVFAAGTLDHVEQLTLPSVPPPRAQALASEMTSAPVEPMRKPARMWIAQAVPAPKPAPQSAAHPAAPTAPIPKFEVAAIRLCDSSDPGGRSGGSKSGGPGEPQGPSPDRLNINCQPLLSLIRMAYVVNATGHRNPMARTPIDSGPSWINSARYQITAKAEGAPGQDVMHGPMLQVLLEDRFKLKIRHESREVPAYALTVARGGSKLKPFQEGSCKILDFSNPPKPPEPDDIQLCVIRAYRRSLTGSGPDDWQVLGATLDEFADALTLDMDRLVINKTAIKGKFDYHLEFTPDETTPFPSTMRRQSEENGNAPAASDPAGGLSIFTAIQQQLGLKLEPAKGPREFLVIDHVEKPSEN